MYWKVNIHIHKLFVGKSSRCFLGVSFSISLGLMMLSSSSPLHFCVHSFLCDSTYKYLEFFFQKKAEAADFLKKDWSQ